MSTRLCLIVLLVAAATACQREAPEAVTPAPPAAIADTTEGKPDPEAEPIADEPRAFDMSAPKRDTTPVDARVTDVRLSNEGDTASGTIGLPTSTFARTDTVYAEVQTTGTAGSYTLYARWLAPDGTTLSDYGIGVNEAGLKRTVISLSKPDGWSPGTNTIELAINGKIERTVPFKVQ